MQKKRKESSFIESRCREKKFSEWIELLLSLKEFIFENLSIASNFYFFSDKIYERKRERKG